MLLELSSTKGVGSGPPSQPVLVRCAQLERLMLWQTAVADEWKHRRTQEKVAGAHEKGESSGAAQAAGAAGARVDRRAGADGYHWGRDP